MPVSWLSFIFPSYSFLFFLSRWLSSTIFNRVYRKNFSNIHALLDRLVRSTDPRLSRNKTSLARQGTFPLSWSWFIHLLCLSSRPGASFSTCFARTRFGWLLQRKPRKIFTSTMYRRFAIDASREFLTRNNKNLQRTRRYVTLH